MWAGNSCFAGGKCMNRTRISRLLSLTALAVIGVLFSSSVIWAQTAPPADTLKVNYFSNANLGYPSATVYVSDPGTNAPANICAMIYVVDPGQELRECCGCMITPDGLLTLSVDWDLTRNSNTPGALNNGTIKIVSSTGAPTCNPSKPVPTATVRAWGTVSSTGAPTCNPSKPVPTATVRAWGTHIQTNGV